MLKIKPIDIPRFYYLVKGAYKGEIMCGTSPGADETMAEQVKMPLYGRVRGIDRCIHHIVAALNAGGVSTTASCCGHQTAPGTILLEDGRCLGIFKNYEEFNRIEKLYQKGKLMTCLD